MASLIHLLVDAARDAGAGTAVDDGHAALTYGELEQRVAALAAGLAAAGVEPGARVALLARNRLEFVELYFALFALGAVMVPVSWRLHPSEVAFVLEDAGAQLVVLEPEWLALCPARPGLERLVIGAARDGARSLDELRTSSPALELAACSPDPAAPAVQMYTSGTTGPPKGSLLTARGILALVGPWLEETGLTQRDRFLQVTPFFHVGGMLMVITAVAARASLRTTPEFLPRPVLDILAREAITGALFVPTMVRWLVDEARKAPQDFPALRLLIYGAAPMPVPLLEEAMARFGCDFLQGYGLTESAGVLTVLRPAEHRFEPGQAPPARLASAGRPIACCELRLVDPEGRDVAPGEIGEVIARGANLMLGYWQRPEADAEALRDGWLWTGDLGRHDAEGFLYLVDRRKDMLCVAGQNVYPAEVEAVLARHGLVSDVAVIGIPHEQWGEEVLALLVPVPGASAREPHLDRILIQHCRAHLARYKCPTRVELRDELPRNGAGKLAKRALREPYWAGHERKI